MPRDDLEVRGQEWGQHHPNTSTGTGTRATGILCGGALRKGEGAQNRSFDKSASNQNYVKEVRARQDLPSKAPRPLALIPGQKVNNEPQFIPELPCRAQEPTSSGTPAGPSLSLLPCATCVVPV